MDATLLCLLKDYETAKEIERHLERLNDEVVEAIDSKLNCLTEGGWKTLHSSIQGSYLINKGNWSIDEGWLATFSFEIEDDEDDYDYWLNHLLGYSKYPLQIVFSLSGLLISGLCTKNDLTNESKKLKELLIANNFTESTSRSNKVYYFSRPIFFNKEKFVQAFEDEDPDSGLTILEDIVKELDQYIPLIDEILAKFKKD